jgi:CheY-like chemotaxis protein
VARILVIDDEPAIRHILRVTLETFGHEVIFAEDGLRGIGVARRQHPELILLDLMMPVMDGVSVLDFLAADDKTSGIPVIVLSAVSFGEQRTRVEQAGAARVLSKPFDPDELAAEVDDVLAERPAPIEAPPPITG